MRNDFKPRPEVIVTGRLMLLSRDGKSTEPRTAGRALLRYSDPPGLCSQNTRKVGDLSGRQFHSTPMAIGQSRNGR